ncbi:hypothetical protein QF038_001149 [Pseudarthrobacter sp. W1I19]|nr:hypothetical protein [Pseudarthrobacter sp. W1I19]
MTTSHGLAGSVRENCRGSAEEGDGVGDASEGGGAAVAPSAVVIVAETEGDGGAVGEADDGATASGAAGVQAARTVSPAPAARKRVKLRRLGAVPAGPAAGAQS